MIIDRYIVSEIVKPFVVAIAALIAIFIAFSSAVILNDVVAGEFGVDIVVVLVLLRTLIILEVMLPTALYLSVVISVGRLYKDSEMVAFWALGVSEKRLLRPVLLISVLVAVAVAVVSIYGRPWAYQMSYKIEAAAAAAADLQRLQSGIFSTLGDGRLVVNQQRLDVAQRRAYDVFVEVDTADGRRVIHAESAQLLSGKPEPRVRFERGYAYEFVHRGSNDRVLKFQTLTMQLYQEEPERVRNRRKAIPTVELAGSDKPKEVAEYQWRLSTPLATLLLGALALPLSRSAPRQGRHRTLFLAIVVYALFFNLAGMARTWVENAEIGPYPGIWWVHALLAGFLLMQLFWRPR